MPRGVAISEADYNMIKRALVRSMEPKQIKELTGFSEHTISRVNTTKNYKEFNEKKANRTRVENEHKKIKKEVQKQNDGQKPERKEGIDTSQDIHDIAREMLNIRIILQKLAEDLGVKL